MRSQDDGKKHRVIALSVGLTVALTLALSLAAPAGASVALSPTVAGTLADGVFEFTLPDGTFNDGSFLGSAAVGIGTGSVENAGILEFNLSSITPGATIDGATLHLEGFNTLNVPVALRAYAGNGTLEPADATIGSFVLNFGSPSLDLLTYNLDVTTAVVGIFGGSSMVGFNLRLSVPWDDPSHPFGFHTFDNTTALLTVQLSEPAAASVPEPGALVLVALGLAACALRRRRTSARARSDP